MNRRMIRLGQCIVNILPVNGFSCHQVFLNPVPGATGRIFDAILDRGNSLSCPFPRISASLSRAPESDKRPNFIEFYKTSAHFTRVDRFGPGTDQKDNLMEAP